MDRTILYRANTRASKNSAKRVRLNYSSECILHYIKQCTSKVSDYDIEINADKLQQILFPTPHRMIFISHLSADRDEAHEIKYLLEEYCTDYSCFIDSDVWGNLYEVRKNLEDEYAHIRENLYSLEMVDNISKHLCLILSMALTKAIKDSPFFLYVPHGDESAINTNSITTESPWVCHELLTSSLLQEPPALFKEATVIANKATSNLAFKYRADTQHLHASALKDFITLLNRH